MCDVFLICPGLRGGRDGKLCLDDVQRLRHFVHPVRQNNGPINPIPEVLKSMIVLLKRYRLKSVSAAVAPLPMATGQER